MVMGDYSNGKEQRTLSEINKQGVNKNNFDSVLAEFAPALTLAVPNTLLDDNCDTPVELNFQGMKDFEPEQVARTGSPANPAAAGSTGHAQPVARP